MKGYALAGELYGYLREAFGFGELTMFTRTLGQESAPRAMSYQWTFNAGSRRYACEEVVLFDELESMRNLEDFAEDLSEKWKMYHDAAIQEAKGTQVPTQE